jgi:hypothetical protein
MARIYWFVVVAGGDWAVKREGEVASRTFRLQADAIDHAAGLAKAHHQAYGVPTGVRIQGEDGRWRDERSYGDDPNPPRG